MQNLAQLEALAEEGMDIPLLRNMPKLDAQAEWVWKAWAILTNKRFTNEAGPQPIQMSEIVVYLNEMKIWDEETRENFLQLITIMDDEWRSDFYRKKAARERQRKSQR